MKSFDKIRIGVAAVATLAGVNGCSIIESRHEMVTIARFATLEGEVHSPTAGTHPVVVFLFNEREGKKVVRSRYVRYGSGPFRFRIDPEEPAFLFAIEDTDENVAWDDGEPSGWYGGRKAAAIELAPAQTFSNLTIELATEAPEGVAELRALQAKGRAGSPAMMTFHEGDLATLDDTRFSAENATKGLWQPIEFVRQFGYGIYFLESYDPERIPVVFVHGAGGTPREFAEIIGRLDRKRFQPWIAHYPSGARIGVLGDGLRGVLDGLHAKYKFPRLLIVAHSMGGLVSRACINEIVARGEKQYVAGFVSVSTPWLGHALAEAGTQRSPIVIPAWFDLAPTSPFLHDLLREPLPPAIPHHLFFSYEGGRGTDGTVSLASELAPRAQDGAAGLYGFAENHVSILKSEAMIAKLNTVLESFRPVLVAQR